MPSLKPEVVARHARRPRRRDEAVEPPANLHRRRACAWRCPATRAAPCPRCRRRSAAAGRRRAAPGRGCRSGTSASAPDGSACATRARSARRTAGCPTPTVIVSPSAGTTGPSVPLSDGGAPVPRLRGTPPAVRNRARSVSVRSSSPSARRSAAVTSNTAKQAAGGGGETIPAWCRPWNGTAGKPSGRVRGGAELQRTVGGERIARLGGLGTASTEQPGPDRARAETRAREKLAAVERQISPPT